MSIDLDAERLPACPRCGGEHQISEGWLDSLTWKHRTSCPLYERDSATAAADHENGRGVRPMTPTERELIQHVYEIPPADFRLGVKFRHTGVHRRRVVLLDDRDHAVRPARRRGADDA